MTKQTDEAAVLTNPNCWTDSDLMPVALMMLMRPTGYPGAPDSHGLNILVTRLLDELDEYEQDHPRLRNGLGALLASVTGPGYGRWDDLAAGNQSRLLLRAVA